MSPPLQTDLAQVRGFCAAWGLGIGRVPGFRAMFWVQPPPSKLLSGSIMTLRSGFSVRQDRKKEIHAGRAGMGNFPTGACNICGTGKILHRKTLMVIVSFAKRTQGSGLTFSRQTSLACEALTQWPVAK